MSEPDITDEIETRDLALAVAGEEIERLRERCEAYKGQLKAGADEIERLRKLEKTNDETLEPAMATFEQVRAATIEECAQIADGFPDPDNIAVAIRTLKEQK